MMMCQPQAPVPQCHVTQESLLLFMDMLCIINSFSDTDVHTRKYQTVPATVQHAEHGRAAGTEHIKRQV
jgi:hypothetical protein